jgi:hypothetical protein
MATGDVLTALAPSAPMLGVILVLWSLAHDPLGWVVLAAGVLPSLLTPPDAYGRYIDERVAT